MDYGCGSGNNSCFFLEQGYDVYGVDVAPSFLKLLSKNLVKSKLDEGIIGKFKVIAPDSVRLDFPDDFFDFIVSNQVLYYLPSRAHLKSVTRELKRVLKRDGKVFFTMMGPSNYHITHHLKQIHNAEIFEIAITWPGHRLDGVNEKILLVRDEADLIDLFSDFSTLTVGHFEQSMFDMKSNFHFIFAGTK